MRRVPLSRGMFAIVDDEDYELISKRKWYASQSRNGVFYARSNIVRDGRRTGVWMHRLIMGSPKGRIDHKNHDGLDNRRDNLRMASLSENGMNAKKTALPRHSVWKGVSWSKRFLRWVAYIRVNGCQKHLGYFRDEIEAAMAYNKAATQFFGEFARVNEVSP